MSLAANQARRRQWIEIAPVALLAASAVLALVLVGVNRPGWSNAATTYALAAGLAAVLAGLVWSVVRRGGAIALLSPVALACFVHFFLGYVTPILAADLGDGIFVKTANWTRQADPVPLMNRTLILAILCALAIGAGFHAPLSRRLAAGIAERLRRTGWIRRAPEANFVVLIAMLGIAVGAVLIQVRLGVFGYSSNYQALFEFAAYRRVLDLCVSLLALCLFLLALRAFAQGRAGRPSYGSYLLMMAVFGIHIAIGLLTGFKGQVVMPAVIVGVAYFMIYRRAPLILGVLGVVLLVFAYSVVEPFRELRYARSNFQSNSLASIVNTMMEAGQTERSGSPNTGRRFLQRSELISPTSAALQHADGLRAAGERAPHFAEAIVLAPALAFVPRAIWPDKPIYQFGKWFAMSVLRQPATMINSVGMGPISYFNYMGGFLAALAGFFAIGVLMRLLWSGLTPLGAGGWLMYLAVLQPLVTLPGEVGPVFTGIIQMLPLAMLAQYVVLRRSP